MGGEMADSWPVGVARVPEENKSGRRKNKDVVENSMVVSDW